VRERKGMHTCTLHKYKYCCSLYSLSAVDKFVREVVKSVYANILTLKYIAQQYD